MQEPSRDDRKRDDARWLRRTTAWVLAGSVLGTVGLAGYAAATTVEETEPQPFEEEPASLTAAIVDTAVQAWDESDDDSDEDSHEGGEHDERGVDDGGWFSGGSVDDSHAENPGAHSGGS